MSFGWQSQHCFNSTAPRELSFSSTAISLVLFVVAAPWNFLICFTIYKNPHKNLRTPFNLLILNVALADLIQGIAVLPLSAAYHGLEGFQKASTSLLKALHLFFFISCTASIMSIGALAVDRCISISYPLKYRSKSTYSRSIRISIMIWLISTGISVVYFHVDFIVYTFVFVNCVLLLTVAVLLFVQFWVNKSLRNHRERREFRPPSQISRADNNTTFDSYRNKMVKHHTRVTRTFLAILMAFLFLNTPSFVFAYVLNFCRTCDCDTYHIFRDLHFLFVLFPSSVNPFLFGFRLPHFKRALITIISRKPQTSETQLQIDMTSTADDGLSQVKPGTNCQVSETKPSMLENGFLAEANKKTKRNATKNGNKELGIVNKDFVLASNEEIKHCELLRISSTIPQVLTQNDSPQNSGIVVETSNREDYRLTSMV